jgi:hypothetical protein
VVRNPVPLIVSVCAAAPAGRVDGDKLTTVGTGLLVAATTTVVGPDFVASCCEVAVIVAVPVVAGVKMPALVILPMFVGLTDQLTELLYAPVPTTLAVQVEV